MERIYDIIKKNNLGNLQKQVMSITTDEGVRRSYTYGEMFEAVMTFAQKLLYAGIKKGDRIVIAAENSPEWNIAYLSVMYLNCTAVLVDFSLPANDILKLIENSDSRCIFSSPNVIKKINSIFTIDIPVLNVYENAAAFEGYSDKISSKIGDTPDGDDEVAFIIYSSGTTKTATGIMHTHEAMIGTTYAAIDFNKLDSNEKMLVVIPNSHIYGVVTSMLGPLILGGSMHFIESMTGANVVAAFNEFHPTVFSCVPRVFEMFEKQIKEKIHSKKLTSVVFNAFFPLCVKLREKTGINLGKIIFASIKRGFGGKIKIFCAAGAPMNPETTRFYFGAGLDLFLNYGLTETNVPIIANGYGNYTLNSCGKLYPRVQMKLSKIDDEDIQKKGEILIKTPFIMKGYFRDEKATEQAYEDGWFKTGDIGVLDLNGNISVVGRCKDNIVLASGKKVTPDDVEEAYSTVKGVKEFVACGIPQLKSGHDEIHGFLVASETFSHEEILDAIHAKSTELSSYMQLAKLHFVDEIPKTSLQKPKRYLLKKLALEEAEALEISAPNEADSAKREPIAVIAELIGKVRKTDMKITENTRIFEDLGFDSLNGIELCSLIEDNFSKSIAYCFKPLITVGQMIAELAKPAVSTIDLLFSKKFPVEKAKFDYLLFKFYSVLVRWVYKVEVKGIENLPKNNGYIICPNHQTNFDFLWVTTKFGKHQFEKLGCMAKKELFNQSLSSKLLSRVCGMIPIDRENQNIQAIELCKQKLKEGWNFLIYPEGTRTKTGEMGEFKKGAAMIAVTENVPIVPVKIKGGFEIFPAGHKLPKLFDFKKMRRLKIEVCFAAPIAALGMDIDSLNNKLRSVVAAM